MRKRKQGENLWPREMPSCGVEHFGGASQEGSIRGEDGLPQADQGQVKGGERIDRKHSKVETKIRKKQQKTRLFPHSRRRGIARPGTSAASSALNQQSRSGGLDQANRREKPCRVGQAAGSRTKLVREANAAERKTDRRSCKKAVRRPKSVL